MKSILLMMTLTVMSTTAMANTITCQFNVVETSKSGLVPGGSLAVTAKVRGAAEANCDGPMKIKNGVTDITVCAAEAAFQGGYAIDAAIDGALLSYSRTEDAYTQFVSSEIILGTNKKTGSLMILKTKRNISSWILRKAQEAGHQLPSEYLNDSLVFDDAMTDLLKAGVPEGTPVYLDVVKCGLNK